MDIARTGPIALAEQRLAHADRRQRILAQNIANADTPGYQSRDLVPFSAAVARQMARGEGQTGGLVRTNPLHIASTRGVDLMARTSRNPAERTPNGNTVSIDREAIRVAETDQAHAMALGLHRKFLGMFRSALGRQ